MALRNQPYFPLYVQDFMTDEKLNECSAKANGVYIRLMCLMHKSEKYGQILLKQKYKQNFNFAETLPKNLPQQNWQQISFFAEQLSKQMPFSIEEISSGLEELLREKVVQIEGDILFQKRMVKDGILSDKRASAGLKGAKKTNSKHQKENFADNFAAANSSANNAANSENEIEIESEIETENINSDIHENFVPKKIKKIDPYFSDERKIFDKTYENIFGQAPYLANDDCLNFSEIASKTPAFFETLETDLKKLKKIDFKKIGYKPSASWFLKEKNYADLRNGVYDSYLNAEEGNDKNDGYSY